jgi:tetratricopeptide (TPR) repeat protein
MGVRVWIGICAIAFGYAQAPTDSNVCASCHPKEARAYRSTGMAGSFYRPTPENTIEDYSKSAFYHEPSGTHYEMIRRDGRYFQRQYIVDFDGKPANVVENQIDFVLGSGNHARTYLHRTAAGALLQLPLGWYSEHGGSWGMNPGYDRPDHPGLQRKVTNDCMFCHNAYPDVPPGGSPRAEPVFTGVGEGIDCQRCHGAGGKHVALARQAAGVEAIRAAIVNPSRLPSERQLEVCMQCHLETTSSALPASIVKYERGPFSYRAGEPLADFIFHFDNNLNDKFEITGSGYRLLKSACFRKSGSMTCTTCHDPHNAPANYTAVCRQCHGAAIDKLASAGSHTKSADCISCHMPKRRTDDVVHAVMTDHYIQRNKTAGDLLAEKPEVRQTESNGYRGEVVLYYPKVLPRPEDQLYLAIAQVTEKSNLQEGIGQLRAAIAKYHPAAAEYYLQLGDALAAAGRLAEAVPVYEEATRRGPQNAAGFVRLALCLSSLRQYPRAEATFRRALEIAASAPAWVYLGQVQVGEGKISDAIASFEKAIALDPTLPDAYNSVGGIWLETGDKSRAETALRTAIRLQPNYAPAHNNLATLLSEMDRFDEARFHFEAALRFQENYNGARYNYAIALVRAHRVDQAEGQVRAILQSDPGSAEAHEFLGNLLRAKGQADAAIEQFRAAIAIEPEFARANLDLGAMLADGDPERALPFLRKAAQSPDAQVREEALKILGRLGK